MKTMNELLIETRINLLRNREFDNSKIIRKLERKLRQIRKQND